MRFGSKPGDLNWNPIADIAEPYNVINIIDVSMVRDLEKPPNTIESSKPIFLYGFSQRIIINLKNFLKGEHAISEFQKAFLVVYLFFLESKMFGMLSA